MMVSEGRIAEKVIQAHKSNDLTALNSLAGQTRLHRYNKGRGYGHPHGADGDEGGFYTGRSHHPCSLHGVCPVRPPLGFCMPNAIRGSQQALEGRDKEGEGRQSCERLAPINAPIAIVACR